MTSKNKSLMLKKYIDFLTNFYYNIDKEVERMTRSINKRVSEISSWDLDKGCRNFINQSSPKNRRLKKIIRKNDRKRLDNFLNKCYND